MTETLERIKAYEQRIEEALQTLELAGELDRALEVYRAAGNDLETLNLSPDPAATCERQRVLAYCLMRQANILRQMGEVRSALELGQREMAAARASGDQLTLARSLMSNGTNLIVGGEIQRGLMPPGRRPLRAWGIAQQPRPSVNYSTSTRKWPLLQKTALPD